METEANEATFEGLMETGHEVTATEDQFDPNAITHAMITADGTTVPITLNPETGQFMTPDGQAVQVQMASDETEYMEGTETVLPDQVEEVDVNMEQTDASSFQVLAAPEQPQPQTVIVKEEGNYSLIEQSAPVTSGNIQVLSNDGSMYFMTSDMQEAAAAPAIQMVTTSGETIDASSLQGGKIRIVNEEVIPRGKVITLNQQQYVVSQPSTSQAQVEKPKVVIRPAIAPKTEPKVQYVKVVGSKPMAQQTNERKVVTLRSGGGMPILPKDAGNILKIALPTAENRVQKTQRIILPSETVKVVDASSFQQQQQAQRKVVTMEQAIVPKIEPGLVATATTMSASAAAAIESPRTSVEKMPDIFESTGVKPRKPCNCTKSQCLKLYCECFANGEFCNNCNCNNCFNNLAHEEARQRSIKQCLERNPNAFRPKIGKLNSEGERRHNKGCNCKRSGCLKNYCECYEAKIGCTKNCRCIGCKNIEVTLGRKPDPDLSTSVVKEDSSVASGGAIIKREPKPRINPLSSVSGNAFRPVSGVRQPFNFVTNEVVEATCQCLLAQAEEAERNGKKEVEIEGLIIEEFGRCLSQIIEMANKSIC